MISYNFLSFIPLNVMSKSPVKVNLPRATAGEYFLKIEHLTSWQGSFESKDVAPCRVLVQRRVTFYQQDHLISQSFDSRDNKVILYNCCIVFKDNPTRRGRFTSSQLSIKGAIARGLRYKHSSPQRK